MLWLTLVYSLFLIVTGFFIIVYFELLYDKITRPQFKNMNATEALFFGLIIGLFIVADFFIVRRFVDSFKKAKKTND
jgi:hypothetical protein